MVYDVRVVWSLLGDTEDCCRVTSLLARAISPSSEWSLTIRYGVFGHIPIVTCPNFSRIIVSPCGIRVISVFVFMLL